MPNDESKVRMLGSNRRKILMQGETQHPAIDAKEYSEEEAVEMWKKVGKIGAEIREKVAAEVKPGKSVMELCNLADDLIKKAGVKPSFPMNVSINDVAAHYTSPIGDETIIPETGVVKIDIGVSIDGFISDTATSIDLDGTYADLVDATKEALNAAIELMRAGANTGPIGGVIEKTITEKGFTPVKELRGHSIERYVVHGQKAVPNIFIENGDILEAGEIVAIEPFATTGLGGLQEDISRVNIFRILPFKVPLRTKPARKIQQLAIHEFGGMPFAERWLVEHGLKNAEIRIGMRELRKAGALHEYHVLRATEKDAIISQHEHTMLITSDGAEVTTRL